MNLLNSLASQPLMYLSIALLLGLIIGSFLNVLVHRLPIMLERQWQAEAREVLELPSEAQAPRFDLLLPPSQCPHCAHRIRPWENIPVISYLALRGRCSSCQARISPRYPLVELACGALTLFVAWRFGVTGTALALLLLSWGLLAMSMIDIEHHLLPDALVLPLLWLGLIVNAFEMFVPLEDALWGTVAGYLSLWSVFWLFKMLTGKEGMGYGDFKLLAMLGAWGGWQILPLTLLLSSLLGAVIGLIMLRLQRKQASTPIPFGPYLAIAGWIALLWGGQITTSYLKYSGF
ncbi:MULTISPECIES: A24 family peptidase [Pseudomonas]|uniref:prepilin peptidase n=1 Tax=Pseudomonas TaxID=286 RepID=UPI000C29934D|nr:MULTISPECIES: A24 family peptidase [Pseudomonas]MBF4207006.1 prepilin peptidase [Pseudomonas donghuensis]MBS7597811.1 prepilin peptidase [Pseudomonas sp. RC2C2]MCP6699955.1 A24 family peptidase [Pseudomonas donghuensis]PJY96142.1 prepilin peptidase [Pseudomonas donghuensis]UVL23611.1 A24 family peptidase [Pseudomonas donghuensis]